MRQLATVPSVGNSSPTTTVRRNSSAEADNVSLSSVATGSEVDAGLQETYIGLVSICGGWKTILVSCATAVVVLVLYTRSRAHQYLLTTRHAKTCL